MTEQLLEMTRIRLDGDTQPRVILDEHVVHEYAEAVREGADFPPVQVVHDGSTYWLVDGYHRFMAHRQVGRAQIKAEVIAGDLATARWLCLAANKTHGLRRTNLDKHRAVNYALDMRPELSDSAIAEHVGVTRPMVTNRRSEIELEAQRTEVAVCGKNQETSTEPTCKSFTSGASRTTEEVPVNPPRSRETIQPAAPGLDDPPSSPSGPPAEPVYRTGRDGRRINVARIGRARRRGPSPHQPPSPEHMAHSLIRLFSTEALRVVVTIISKHLEGGASPG